jgi:type VI secretion system protein ImpG
MDPRLLALYNAELAHLRETGAEFAAEFPKVAARLGLEGMDVADPYVERLMEGFAFVAARVRLKLDAEFPRFTQHLLEMVYPHHLAPTPAAAIAAFSPNFADTGLATGVKVPRGTALRTGVPRGEQTACEFRTAHEVTLWPIELTDVRYTAFAPDLPLDRTAADAPVKGVLRLRLRCHAGMRFSELACDTLAFHIAAPDETAHQLYELLFGAGLGGLVCDPAQGGARVGRIAPRAVEEAGFADDEALLPSVRRSFRGYRLLQEYFAFPQRYLFFRLSGLAPALRQLKGGECEVALLFGRGEPALEPAIDAAALALYATPVVNLFPRRADRIHLADNVHEHHLVVDRARPLDFEVHTVRSVAGLGVAREEDVAFLPFYGGFDEEEPTGHAAYFTVRREPRMPSSAQRQYGGRSGYHGSEVFIALTDPREAPYPRRLQQLAVEVLATNRDLPLLLPIGSLGSMVVQESLPIEGVRVLRGPSRARSGLAEGEYAWRLINHLTLNHVSILDRADGGGVAALRELLSLYTDPADPSLRRQVEAITRVASKPVVRRLPVPGPIAFGRGLAIELAVDELAFPGGGSFLFGSVLEKFFARYVSLNAFTETTLVSESRGRVAAWPPRVGARILG